MQVPLLADDLDQPRFVLLDRRVGWRAAMLDNVEQSYAGGLRLRALPSNGRPLVDSAGSFGGLVEPAGLAVDRWGNIYLVDRAAGLIKRFDPCCAGFEVLPCIGGCGSAPRQLRDPRGIAISPMGLLYIVDSGNRRVQVFSLQGFALLNILGPLDRQGRRAQPSRVPPADPTAPCGPTETYPAGTWLPWAIALNEHDQVFVSDFDNGLIHRFDRDGRWLKAFDGAGSGNPPLSHPTQLAIDREGQLYVVQDGRDYVVILDSDGGYIGRAAPLISSPAISVRSPLPPTRRAICSSRTRRQNGCIAIAAGESRERRYSSPDPR